MNVTSQLEALLDGAIHSDLDLVQLEAAASAAENAITKARADLAEAETAETDLRDSIRAREKRLATFQEESQRRRNDFIKKYFKGSFKLGLADESAAWVSEDAQIQILKASIVYGLSLIPKFAAATRKARLHVLECSAQWLRSQGLLEARKSYELFLPVLANDLHCQIDLRSSKASAYSIKILEFEQQIAEWHTKELTYGPTN